MKKGEVMIGSVKVIDDGEFLTVYLDLNDNNEKLFLGKIHSIVFRQSREREEAFIKIMRETALSIINDAARRSGFADGEYKLGMEEKWPSHGRE